MSLVRRARGGGGMGEMGIAGPPGPKGAQGSQGLTGADGINGLGTDIQIATGKKGAGSNVLSLNGNQTPSFLAYDDYSVLQSDDTKATRPNNDNTAITLKNGFKHLVIVHAQHGNTSADRLATVGIRKYADGLLATGGTLLDSEPQANQSSPKLQALIDLTDSEDVGFITTVLFQKDPSQSLLNVNFRNIDLTIISFRNMLADDQGDLMALMRSLETKILKLNLTQTNVITDFNDAAERVAVFDEVEIEDADFEVINVHQIKVLTAGKIAITAALKLQEQINGSGGNSASAARAKSLIQIHRIRDGVDEVIDYFISSYARDYTERYNAFYQVKKIVLADDTFYLTISAILNDQIATAEPVRLLQDSFFEVEKLN